MQMSCYSQHRGRSYNNLCPFTSYRYALKLSMFMFKLESANDGETQEQMTTCTMQQDISEWLVDEFR